MFQDFNAKVDPVLATFLAASKLVRGHGVEFGVGLLLIAGAAVWIWSLPSVRGRAVELISRLPIVRPAMEAYRATLFCRNLSLLLSSGVTLSSGLKILADIMAGTSDAAIWSSVVDKVRHGGKLSEALAATQALPPMAIRTLRLGEGTGQLPTLASRVADFYEAKLQRILDRVVGVVGPVAILFISLIVGGLIVSIMTALMSVNEVVN